MARLAQPQRLWRMASEPSSPVQYDIYGNPRPYQNLVHPDSTGRSKGEVWYVHWVRTIRDWRKLTNPDTGTVYEYVTDVPRAMLDTLVSWGKAEKFDTRDEAIARAKSMIGEYKTFSAGVWPSNKRVGQPSFLISITSREEAERSYEQGNLTAERNVKPESKKASKFREQN